jgi:peptidoglycan-N-acetylglucosamine deacetylase
MKKIILFLFLIQLLVSCKSSIGLETQNAEKQPKIAFTFDDPVTDSILDYPNEEWNSMILNTLKSEKIKAALFVCGKRIDSEKGKKVLQSWDNSGHLICNHSYNHNYFHSKKVSLEDFKKETLKNDSLIKNYKNYTKLFRFPYLKEGNSEEKINGFRTFLKENNYKNGHVSIDASDWYIADRLNDALKKNPKRNTEDFKQFYINHIYNRALFYDSIATNLTNRKINHTLLLHHNLTSALFLKDLVKHFRSKGWQIVNIDKAFEDEFYKSEPKINPAGESLTWGLAKESGKFEKVLRYPAEDGDYEKEAMDKLGL